MNEFKNFKEFYSFYLTQHQNPICKRLHFIGTFLVCLCLLTSLLTRNFYWLILTPVLGYGFAWIGHYAFEKNKPATFKHPFYSLLADFVLFKDLLSGKNK